MGKSRNIARLIVDATGAVDATNLGNAVPADGSITEAKLASDSVTAAKIATGAVGADELAATAVTAGTYGTASAIPAITVDADGRITGVSTNAVSASAPSTADVLAATAGLTAGGVGTYAAVYFYELNTNLRTFGTNEAGSGLRILNSNYVRVTISGTWKFLGVSEGSNGGNGMYVRVA